MITSECYFTGVVYFLTGDNRGICHSVWMGDALGRRCTNVILLREQYYTFTTLTTSTNSSIRLIEQYRFDIPVVLRSLLLISLPINMINRDTLIQCSLKVGPMSQAVGQLKTNIGSTPSAGV